MVGLPRASVGLVVFGFVTGRLCCLARDQPLPSAEEHPSALHHSSVAALAKVLTAWNADWLSSRLKHCVERMNTCHSMHFALVEWARANVPCQRSNYKSAPFAKVQLDIDRWRL